MINELAEDGFVYRFRQDSRPLHKAEGAFLLCGFWMAQAASARGDEVTAAHWFERSRSACGPAGLYAEEFDVHQRQMRGNLPQAFVHAGMLGDGRTAVGQRDERARLLIRLPDHRYLIARASVPPTQARPTTIQVT